MHLPGKKIGKYLLCVSYEICFGACFGRVGNTCEEREKRVQRVGPSGNVYFLIAFYRDATYMEHVLEGSVYDVGEFFSFGERHRCRFVRLQKLTRWFEDGGASA